MMTLMNEEVKTEATGVKVDVDMGEVKGEVTVRNTDSGDKEKRHYTKRGTTKMVKRVVLLDGKPVGRGRPSKAGKGKRTVVYIGMDENYNKEKHGIGTEYRNTRHGVFKRQKIDTKVK